MSENRARKVCRGAVLCSNVCTFGLDTIEIDFKEWDEILIIYVM